jgi:hypothetical protein
VSAEMMMPVGAPRLEIGGRPDPKHCHTRDHSRVIGGPDSCPGSACSEEVIGRNVADHSRHAATAAGATVGAVAALQSAWSLRDLAEAGYQAGRLDEVRTITSDLSTGEFGTPWQRTARW